MTDPTWPFPGARWWRFDFHTHRAPHAARPARPGAARPAGGRGPQPLTEGLWRRFAPMATADAPEILLGKLAMAACDDQGIQRPTVAGLLMACEHPQRLLPGAFVQAVAYAGTSVTPDAKGAPYQLDAQDLTGPLDRQIADACDFVKKNMRVAARKRPQGGRADLPQYDLLDVFEAVTNALAHRDYSMAGSKVRLSPQAAAWRPAARIQADLRST